jgi:hypothetical protein
LFPGITAIGARGLSQPPENDFMRYWHPAGRVHEITAADITASDERRAVILLWWLSLVTKESHEKQSA